MRNDTILGMLDPILKYIHKKLFQLGKTFGLDLPYFVKNHFFLSIGTTINIFSGFILSLLYARLLDKTTYGQYVLIFSIISTLSITRLTGLQSILPYAITNGNEGFFPKAQKVSFLTSLVGTLAILGVTIYYLLPGKPPLAPALFVTALLFPFINSLNYYSSYLTTKKQFKKSSFYFSIQATIPNLAIALTIIFLPKTFWLILAALLPQALLNIYFTIKTLGQVKNRKNDGKDFLYGLKLSLVYLPSTLIQNLDDFFLAKFLGFEKLAIYSFASVIPQQLSPFLKNFGILSVPKIAALSDDKVLQDVPKKTFQFMLVTGTLALTYILAAPFFFNHFYPAYTQSLLPSQIYALTLVFYPYVLVSDSLHRLRLFKHTAIFNWGLVIAKLILLIVLIPRYGVIGASIAAVSLEGFKLLFALTMLKTVKFQKPTR